jgi:nucleotide-binding universal stress UspA family protein
MYRKILVPLDGSVLAEGVLPYVRSIARAIQVPVELLQVNDRARARAYVPAVQVAQYLEKIAASFSGITDVKSTLELGNPADAIVDHAAGQPDALIAMATHGVFRGPTLASRKRRRKGLARGDKPFVACPARRGTSAAKPA